MIGTEAFDAFVTQHRWCVVTTLRKDGSASSSVNAYAREGDQLIISTQAHRLKVKTLERDPRITVAVISNQEPFSFVTIEGTAQIQRTDLVGPTRRVLASLASTGYQVPPDLPQWLEKQGRVIIRVTPQRISGVLR